MNFVIDRSWRTWKTNQITPTYLRSHSQGQYVVPLKGNSYHLRSQSIRVGIERVELQDRWEEELELQPKGFAIWHHGDTIKCMLRDDGDNSWLHPVSNDTYSVIEDIFGHNQFRSYCLQVQPVTCWHPPVFLHQIGVYSIYSSKMMGNFPAVLNFYRLFLKLNRFICN